MAEIDNFDEDGDDGAPPADGKAVVHVNPGGSEVASGDLTPEELERFNIKGQMEHATRLQAAVAESDPNTGAQVQARALAGLGPAAVPTTGPTPAPAPPPADDALARALIAKFPDFNPGWKDELKKQWFDGYVGLMKMVRG